MTLFVFRLQSKSNNRRAGETSGNFRDGESFSDLLSFASGFTEFAYTASVNVLQKTAKEFKVQDITL
jgi:hypothetical protein